MEKTIRPKDKTRKLRDATLELMRRNDKVRECFEKIVNEKKPEIPRELLETAMVPNAVAGFRFCNGTADPGRMYYHPREGCDLEKVLTLLHGNKPNDTLIVGVDLTRPKDSILAEISSLLDMQLNRTGHREKWLPIVDELLQVWDMWAAYEKRRCFHLIAKRLSIPETTVKARWKRAYILIHRKPYTKKTGKSSAIELCAKCKDQGKCYKTIDGVMDFYPCAAYLKLTGKSYTREKLLENFDAVADQFASDIFKPESVALNVLTAASG